MMEPPLRVNICLPAAWQHKKVPFKFTSIKITTKGQVTIPKKVRDDLGVTTGDIIVFSKKGEDIIIKPASTLLDLKGIIDSPKKVKDWNGVRRTAKRSVAKRVVESLK